MIFYSENINYVYRFYGTEIYVNVCRSIFRTQEIIDGGAFLRKLQKNFIADVPLVSKYVSGIKFHSRIGLQNVNTYLI